MDWTCPRCDYPATSYKSLATHFRHSHNGDSALLAALGSEKLLREYEENSVLALSEEYGVSRNAVKTALKEADQSIREEAGHECEMCGESPDNRGLDVHHIIPLLSVG